MKFNILRFETIGSTNSEALEQARRGADEGLSVTARQQTDGRGRHGRKWISPKDAGLYFSLVLRPKIEMRLLPLITLMSAVAVHETLGELYQLECDIKWVNDVHVGGKKISGILAETCETAKGLAVVVGIGISLNSDAFPFEIAQTATAIETEIGSLPDREKLLENLTGNLSRFYEILNDEKDAGRIRAEWTRRSSYAEGKKVRVTTGNETIEGTTRGIEENGALRIERRNGAISIINAGTVERLRADI